MHHCAAFRCLTLSALAVGFSFADASQSRAASITITPTYDVSITGNANAAAIEAGIQNAINQVQSRVATATATPLNVAITFKDPGTGLGGSNQSIAPTTYASYRAALAARSTSANDATALSNLPNTATFNGFSGMYLTLPHARTLGLYSGGDNATISLNTSLMNFSRTGTLNAAKYDLQTVAMHEIDEILGVGGPATLLGSSFATSNIGSMDVYRYKAPGVVSYSTSDTAYFSINGGNTNIVTFNNVSGGDYADYASNATHYVQDAFGTPGTFRDLATPELTSYDVIGYTLLAVPEPASAAMLGLGAAALLRRRRAR